MSEQVEALAAALYRIGDKLESDRAADYLLASLTAAGWSLVRTEELAQLQCACDNAARLYSEMIHSGPKP